MPRVHYVFRGVRDQVWWDTGTVEHGSQGNRIRLFDNTNIGDQKKCNLQSAGLLHYDRAVKLDAIGFRLLGTTIEEEDMFLDHFMVTFTLGDRPQFTAPAQQMSTLRGRCRHNKPHTLPIGETYQAPLGYHFKEPIIVPVRQWILAYVEYPGFFTRDLVFRILLFGQVKNAV